MWCQYGGDFVVDLFGEQGYGFGIEGCDWVFFEVFEVFGDGYVGVDFFGFEGMDGQVGVENVVVFFEEGDVWVFVVEVFLGLFGMDDLVLGVEVDVVFVVGVVY